MDFRVLTKLLGLMKNLLIDYFDDISKETWHQFATAFSTQSEAISTMIHIEEGPIRKKKAQIAQKNLDSALQQRSISIKGLTVRQS